MFTLICTGTVTWHTVLIFMGEMILAVCVALLIADALALAVSPSSQLSPQSPPLANNTVANLERTSYNNSTGNLDLSSIITGNWSQHLPVCDLEHLGTLTADSCQDAVDQIRAIAPARSRLIWATRKSLGYKNVQIPQRFSSCKLSHTQHQARRLCYIDPNTLQPTAHV